MLDDHALFAELSHLWSLREKGFLPYPGSYLEQPNLYVQAMIVVDATMSEIEQIEERKRKMQADRG